MNHFEELLDDVFTGQERVTRDEIYRRAVGRDLPTELITALESLPEGEYAQDEAAEALAQLAPPVEISTGIPASALPDEELHRELSQVHETRDDTFRHGSAHALAHHDQRTAELEAEYLRRFPEREVDTDRLREGARQRA
jgi:hypothetical protein